MRELPHQNELHAVERQKRWMYLSYRCLTLMFGSPYLGDPIPVIKIAIFFFDHPRHHLHL
jgi:hypothetical protein